MDQYIGWGALHLKLEHTLYHGLPSLYLQTGQCLTSPFLKRWYGATVGICISIWRSASDTWVLMLTVSYSTRSLKASLSISLCSRKQSLHLNSPAPLLVTHCTNFFGTNLSCSQITQVITILSLFIFTFMACHTPASGLTVLCLLETTGWLKGLDTP